MVINDLTPLYHMANYLSKYKGLPKDALRRLKWIDYYHLHRNVSQTCRHFDIPRKTFYKWYKRYDPNNLWTLTSQSKSPHNVRQREITPLQEARIVQLRKKHIKYSKFKIVKIYYTEYNENISSWKVQQVIQKYKLYYNPTKTARIARKRIKAKKKQRIQTLSKKKRNGFLWCLDTVELRVNNIKRYVFTVIDHYSKVAFARMYKNANSYNAADFLNRMLYLNNGYIENIQTDNGSEFEKYFAQACDKMRLDRYYSRPRTPKDNAVNERFNRTLREEFINLGNFCAEPNIFNKNLTNWLIEYNFYRPHATLGYQTPINTSNSNRVSPMYPSYTLS